MKKILLGLGTAATVIAPIAATVSCGDDDKKDLSLEETRTSSIKQINSETDLSQEQKDGFIERINEAKTSAEILEIVNEANQTALEVYKAVQITYVNSLDEDPEGLTETDKTTTRDEINGAKTKTEVDKIVDALPLMILERYKASNALKINKLEKLDDDGKDLWTGKLNDAVDFDSAKDVIDQMNKAIFKQAKKDAVERLCSYTSLSKENVELCGREVADAKNQEELDAAINHMDTLAFGEVKANAVKETNKYQDWTDAEKSTLVTKINAANNVDELNSAIAAAKLNHEKTSSISKIALFNLKDVEESGFTDRINAATTISEIKDIVEEAQLQQAKNIALAGAAGLTLSPSERTSFEEAVANATDLGAVHAASDIASLQNDKNIASATIEGYDMLSQQEKDAFKDMVNKATDKAGINAATDAAVAQKQKNSDLKQAKDAEIGKIGGYTLSDTDRTSFINDVRNAINTDAIKVIDDLALAHQKVEIELNKVKTQAHKTIEGVKDLSAQEKQGFKDDVDKTTEKNQIPPIVDSALLQGAKNNATNNINGYTILPNKKVEFLNAVAKAKTPAEVKAAVDAAVAQQAKETKLKNAKDAAKVAIQNSGLLPSEIATFKSNVDGATDISDIQPIIDAALLQASKEKNLAVLNGLKNMSKAVVNGYISQVNSATTPEAIELITQEAVIIDGYSGSNNFNVTLNDTGNTIVSGVSLDLKHSDSLSGNEKLKVVEELIKTGGLKVENEYDPKYGEGPWLMVEGEVVPGVHHDLLSLTEDEKALYVTNVFTKIYTNPNDESPDFRPETRWGLTFTDEQANICPALTKGGPWTKDSRLANCLHPNDDGLISMETFAEVDVKQMASEGVLVSTLSRKFKIEFFNTIFKPTYIPYLHAYAKGSISQVITDASKLIDGSDHSAGAFQNDLVINGNHFKVLHPSSSLSVAEGTEIYDKLVKSISSLDLIKLEEVKKVSSYNLTDAEKLKLIKNIQGAATVKLVNSYVDAIKSN